MRVLHVTDLHFRSTWFGWLANRAKSGEFDAICLSGDLLDMFPNAESSLTKQAKWFREWAKAYEGCPLFTCSGNHDWWPVDDRIPNLVDNDAEAGWLRKARRPRQLFVDGDSVEIMGVTLACKPWVGAMPAAACANSSPTILLAHAPPQGSRVALNSVGGDAGDFEIAEDARLLSSGSVILSGHVHNPDQWHDVLAGVTCFNPGVDFDSVEVPNHIVLNTETRRADLIGRDGPMERWRY